MSRLTTDNAKAASNPFTAGKALNHSRLKWLIAGCGIVVVIGILAVAAAFSIDLRDRSLTEKSKVLETLTAVLAKKIEQDFLTIELVQAAEIARLQELDITSRDNFKQAMSIFEVHRRLKSRVEALPHIDAIVITDSEGRLINFSRSWPIPEVKVPDQDPSLAFKTDPLLTTLVGKPLQSPVTKTWLLPVARKITGPYGEFLGVMTGVIGIPYFEQMFANVADRPNGSIALFRLDGPLLTRFPTIDLGSQPTFGNSKFPELLKNADYGTLTETGIIDGVERMVSARRVSNYPVALVATTRVDVILANWKRSTVGMIVVVVLTGLIIGGAVMFSAAVVGRKLREQSFQRDLALDNMSQGLCMFDGKKRLVVCNKQYADLYGLTEEQTRPGTPLSVILEHRIAAGQTPSDPQRYLEDRIKEVTRNQPYQITNQLRDGRYILVVHRPLPGGGWVATHEDITALKRGEEALAKANRELTEKQYTIDQAVIAAITDVKGTITYANEKFSQISGYSREELLGANHRLLKSGHHPDSFFQDMYQQIGRGKVWRGEICNKAKDGSLYWVDSIVVPQLGVTGKPIAYMAIRIDITARKLAEGKLSYLASFDTLTGLYNRANFNESLKDALARCAQHQETRAVLMLDLDGFKNINDTLGHAAGDQFLKEEANRLKSVLQDGDAVARLGGDEFAIIQGHRENPRESAIALATKLLDVVAVPVVIDGNNVAVGASIGIAIAPQDGTDPAALLQKADLALYHVKLGGRNNFQFFDKQMGKLAAERQQLLTDLRVALSRDEFVMHYQPVFDAKTGRLYGAEALVRWRHLSDELLSPDRFIPLAEESGLMEMLGTLILKRACADAAKWPNGIKIAINLSATQFRSGKLIDIILRALTETGLPPERLELEITESALMSNAKDNIDSIWQLKKLGISFALDDFGTGYSSLSYLTAFPFDKIKIDKSFIRDMTTRPECATIVSSVLTIARGLDICVTAEGVETEQQLELLRSIGIHQVQGYLFGAPCPADELDFSTIEKNAKDLVAA